MMTTERVIRCRCGFIIVAWDYPRAVSPEVNVDAVFANMKRHSRWWRGHWIQLREKKLPTA